MKMNNEEVEGIRTEFQLYRKQFIETIKNYQVWSVFISFLIVSIGYIMFSIPSSDYKHWFLRDFGLVMISPGLVILFFLSALGSGFHGAEPSVILSVFISFFFYWVLIVWVKLGGFMKNK